MNKINFILLFGYFLFNTSSVICERNENNTFALSYRTTELLTLCIQRMVNLRKFENELQTSKLAGNLTEVLRSKCELKDPLLQCVRRIYPKFFGQPSTNYQILEQYTNLYLIKDIITYHCSNEGFMLNSYFNNINYNCVDEHKTIFQSCFQMTMRNLSFIESNSNEMNCAGIKIVQSCVNYNLLQESSCNGIEISKYINGLLEKIFDDNICRNKSILPLCDMEEYETEVYKRSYESKILSIYIYTTCMFRSLVNRNFFEEIIENKNRQNFTQYFQSFCSQQDTIVQCFWSDFSSHENYTNYSNYLTTNLQFLINQMGYLCHNEGSSLAALFNNNDISCFVNPPTIIRDKSCIGIQSKFISHPLSAMCSFLRKLFYCVINQHRSCVGAIELLDATETFLNTMLDEHLCKNVVKCRIE